MSNALLKQHLKDLDAELKNLDTVDEDSEKLLKEIVNDVQVLLSHKVEFPSVHHATIKERFTQNARHFDISHPSLASILKNIVNTLNSMGI
jgi:predicted rRNA methylase YqxC with S4 and FtsJ domains